MRDVRLLTAAASERWAMEPETLHAMVGVLCRHAAGERLAAEEVAARIAPRRERAVAGQRGAVAVLPLRGVISNRASLIDDVSPGAGTSVERFGQQFRAAMANEDIKAVVLDVDSPGGGVSGVDELSAEIAAARGVKPIIAQVDGMAASAAYWIATSAEEVVATPSSMVGSIGVFSVHEDISGFLEMEGIRPTIISAGRFKVEENPFQPLSDEARAAIQARVDAFHDMFVRRVAENRGTSTGAVRDGFGEGRVVVAGDALGEGMIDRIGTMEETLGRLGVQRDVGGQARARGETPFARMAREVRLREAT